MPLPPHPSRAPPWLQARRTTRRPPGSYYSGRESVCTLLGSDKRLACRKPPQAGRLRLHLKPCPTQRGSGPCKLIRGRSNICVVHDGLCAPGPGCPSHKGGQVRVAPVVPTRALAQVARQSAILGLLPIPAHRRDGRRMPGNARIAGFRPSTHTCSLSPPQGEQVWTPVPVPRGAVGAVNARSVPSLPPSVTAPAANLAAGSRVARSVSLVQDHRNRVGGHTP